MFSQHLKTKENPSFIALVYSEVATIISFYFILRYFMSGLGGVTYIGHYISTLYITYIRHYISALFNLSFMFIHCHKR